MKKIKISLLFIFFCYWLLTLIYVSPNNYLRIEANKLVSIMDIFFYQNWKFFAPPPQYDLRLYYVFKDVNNNIYTLEAISNIVSEKKQKAPFNTLEEFLDYVISGASTHVVDLKSEYMEYAKFLNKDSSDVFCYNYATKNINEEHDKIDAIKTLKRYSVFVKNKCLPQNKILFVKFIITGSDLPKFNDRYTLKREEKKYFESNFFQYESTQ